LCFSLYSASRATTRSYHRLLAPWGLTYPQYLVLVVLWEQGRVSVRTLGAELGLDSGTLSPLLKRLESAGYVTRARAAEDERRVEVTLTESGRRLEGELAGIPGQVGSCMGLDQHSYTQLQSSLRKVNEALRESAVTPTL
jgi:DNA-binding MarR family transcriptional regulator